MKTKVFITFIVEHEDDTDLQDKISDITWGREIENINWEDEDGE